MATVTIKFAVTLAEVAEVATVAIKLVATLAEVATVAIKLVATLAAG